MGDPRKLKNKYRTPIHPWEKLRLDAERPLMKEYGLVNKKELWKVSSKLKNFKDTAKHLVASKTAQASAEKKQMVERMKSYGLISSEELDEILGLDVEQLLDRRLQTVVLKKGLARTIKQARQMITHRHIAVNGTKITAPGYLVKISEQESISFIPGSKFNNEAHPERALAEASELQKEKVTADKKSKPDEKEVAADKKEESKSADDEKPADKKEVAESKKESESDEKAGDVKQKEDDQKATPKDASSDKKAEEKSEVESKKSESADNKGSDKKADGGADK